MSDNAEEIDLSVFDPKKLRKALADIQLDPKLSSFARHRLEMEIAVTLGRFKAIDSMLGPLTDAYYKDRRRKDRSYDPDRDPIFAKTHELALGEMSRLMDEVDKLRDVESKIAAANIGRSHIARCCVEFVKLVHLAYPDSKEATR